MEEVLLYIIKHTTELSIASAAVSVAASVLIWLCEGKAMCVKAASEPLAAEGGSLPRQGAALDPAALSIIVTCHNQAEELKGMLNHIFLQSFTRYEIVVVDIASTDNTADVLRVVCEDHDNVRHTFVPVSSICVDHDYLALVLALRLARTPWALFMPVGATFSQPCSLGVIASHLDDEHDFALIFANSQSEYNNNAEKRLARKSARLQLRTWREAVPGPLPWSGSSIVAMRRSVFSNANGLQAPIPRGVKPIDAIVAEMSLPGRNLIIKDPAAVIKLPPELCCTATKRIGGNGSARRFKLRRAAGRVSLFVGTACFVTLAAIAGLDASIGIIPPVPAIASIAIGLVSIIASLVATYFATARAIATLSSSSAHA